MSEHPIENLMKSAMNSIKDMVDVNTIIGNPIKTETGMYIIPVSKVCFGFAAGGTEFYPELNSKKEEKEVFEYPFGGGSGAAVKINPIGFIIVDSKDKENIPRFIPVEHSDAIDKLLDYVPDLMEKAKKMLDKYLESKPKAQEESNIPEDDDELDEE